MRFTSISSNGEQRLKLGEEDLKAQMIQRMQEFEAISGVCRFRRSPRPVLDDASFREAYQAEAAQWYFGLAAHIQWRIYGSRSY
jgi:hypothetical protein